LVTKIIDEWGGVWVALRLGFGLPSGKGVNNLHIFAIKKKTGEREREREREYVQSEIQC
jgi:hypothetical protein